MSRHLPNSTAAYVEEKKIVDYLLNPAHPDGGSKAKFFWRVVLPSPTGRRCARL